MLCQYAECHAEGYYYAECHYAECSYVESHYAKCRYAERRGASNEATLGCPPAFLSNIILGTTNALAYYAAALITRAKRFVVRAQEREKNVFEKGESFPHLRK
jgi:hypothetical protein